ncbi:hypothetical protein CEXT_114681 [Caerostris extrusa]|uniref:Uncharacterized protein n=1 Tax=Caerostris extrusa TaxID=172846 RepID=A0AAV4X5K7_CAEEX|nr:hypothetical protein CEXT_114681 [Caerostris extrusa]
MHSISKVQTTAVILLLLILLSNRIAPPPPMIGREKTNFRHFIKADGPGPWEATIAQEIEDAQTRRETHPRTHFLDPHLREGRFISPDYSGILFFYGNEKFYLS